MKKINKQTLGTLVIGVIIGWIFFSGGQWFDDRYKFYCPVIIPQSMVCVDRHQMPVEASGSAKLYPTTSEINYNDIFNKIWQKETSKGKATMGMHLQCREIGKWNEIGYGGWGFCFNSKLEAQQTITKYFKSRLDKGWTLEEILCYYNTGIRQTGCRYYKDYKNL